MTQITYRDWILDCDVEATRAGYETISAGGAESCDCAGCRNFLAQRDSVYPAFESARSVTGSFGPAGLIKKPAALDVPVFFALDGGGKSLERLGNPLEDKE
jgi:hypothetical protein